MLIQSTKIRSYDSYLKEKKGLKTPKKNKIPVFRFFNCLVYIWVTSFKNVEPDHFIIDVFRPRKIILLLMFFVPDNQIKDKMHIIYKYAFVVSLDLFFLNQ